VTRIRHGQQSLVLGLGFHVSESESQQGVRSLAHDLDLDIVMGWAPFIWVGLVSCMMLGLGLAFILVPRFPWDQFFDVDEGGIPFFYSFA
jgi:hypothetical protein